MDMPTTFDETGTELSVSAIGQGTVLATPLGMASVAQTIANGGTRSPTPIVTDPALQADAEPVEVTSKENARVMTSLMEAVVDYGTGTSAALSGIQVAGKTGTAELGPKPNQPPPEPVAPGEEPPDPEQIVDAWFIAFAPAQKPKLADRRDGRRRRRRRRRGRRADRAGASCPRAWSNGPRRGGGGWALGQRQRHGDDADRRADTGDQAPERLEPEPDRDPHSHQHGAGPEQLPPVHLGDPVPGPGGAREQQARRPSRPAPRASRPGRRG